MKKIVCVGLAIALLLALAVPSFAAFVEADTGLTVDGKVQISTKSDEAAYEITIPASTEIPWEEPEWALGEVAATKLQLAYDHVVRVTVTSENDFNLVLDEDPTATIGYALTGADAMVFAPGAVDTVYPLTLTVSEDQWAQAAAGRHTDLLTFTAVYEEA